MKISDILSPVRQEEFFENYWGKKPLHIPGNVDKFLCLPNVAELPGILAGKIDGSVWHDTHNLKGQAYKHNPDGSVDKFMDVPIGMYTQMFNSGYGLCFNDVSFAISELDEILTEFSDGAEPLGQDSVTCYLTPPDSRGVLHFDNQHVFFVQRVGAKNWRISNQPGISNPFENLIYPSCDKDYFNYMAEKGYNIKLPSECGYRDLTLQQGDVLYMPPGYYHVGNTGDGLSFHYTITIEPISFHSKIYALMHEKARKNSIVINKDLRFATQVEAEEILENSRKIFLEILDEKLLRELMKSIRLNRE